jgi:hypothetical protein
VKISDAPTARLGRRARLPGCRAARPGADRRQSRAGLGAATGRTPDSKKVAGRKPTTSRPAADRRQPGAEPPRRIGLGRHDSNTFARWRHASKSTMPTTSSPSSNSPPSEYGSGSNPATRTIFVAAPAQVQQKRPTSTASSPVLATMARRVFRRLRPRATASVARVSPTRTIDAGRSHRGARRAQ